MRDPFDSPLYDPEDDVPDDELAYLGLHFDNPMMPNTTEEWEDYDE